MGDFNLPSLPPDYVPNFLTQPQPINNDIPITELLDQARAPQVTIRDDTRTTRFPKFDTNAYNFLDELRDSLNNLAQNTDREESLSTEQWVECAALYSQSIVEGLVKAAGGKGANSFRTNLPLESRIHAVELAKNIEKINRYFQLPYDEHTTTNYCHKCLVMQGTTPSDWQAHLELCGHNATAARDSLHNQYIQELNTQMLLWYESQRALVHDQIILNITNDNFAPDILTADPRIREWAKRVKEDARERALIGIDAQAKQAAEDDFQSTLTRYKITHENDLDRVHDDYQRELSKRITEYQENLNQAEVDYRSKLKEVQERPIITDPTARKKQRGSVSAINSPTVTKAQPIQTQADLPDPSMTHPQTVNPEPSIALPTTAPPIVRSSPTPIDHPTSTNQPSAPTDNPDPIAQIMNLMSAQFQRLSDQLDKIENSNNNEYSAWETTWDANQNTNPTWRGDLSQIDDKLEEDAKRYANLDYSDTALYDIPTNEATYMAEAEDAPGREDSDCILLSGPPTPTAANTAPTLAHNPAPSGLRPPERAQRVDFQSAKLATDSFGIPVGGICKADRTISFSATNPTRNTKPRGPTNPTQHPDIYSNEELQRINKDAIIAHAMFAFQHKIPRKYTKPQVIAEYQTVLRLTA